MANISLLMKALSFIEESLDEDLKTEDIAKQCFASKSSLEKVFKFTTHFSVHDYITRRRMMKASRMMIEKPELSLLEIGTTFGYSSHEAFTRAFYSVWKCNPSEYRQNQKGKLKPFELFPKIVGAKILQGEDFMKKTVDISELYDFFIDRKDCYFVCCDIQNLIGINNISREAGDIAILESMKRMEKCSGNDDVVFRIGCDEFCLITASKEKAYADEICKKILSMNGETFSFKNQTVSLKLYGTVTKIEQKHIHFNELFEKLSVSQEEKKEQLEK